MNRSAEDPNTALRHVGDEPERIALPDAATTMAQLAAVRAMLAKVEVLRIASRLRRRQFATAVMTGAGF
jgi:hypothetical protein